MERILVGTDGSVSAEAALRWAAHLAVGTGAELVVARAWVPMQAEEPPDLYEERRREADRVLDEEWCEAARSVGARYRTAVLEGDPREVLLDAAGREDADLLIVGARGAGSHPHALHLGSVTHHVAHHTTRPLAMVPAASRRVSPPRILVGADGSPGSAQAIEWCRNVAPALDAEVVVAHAERPVAEWVAHDDPKSWYQQALQDCTEWAAPLREAGIATHVVILQEDPVKALTDAGVREQASMLVVGTRGLGGVFGLRLGSTALKVLHHSGLPVVLVPPAT